MNRVFTACIIAFISSSILAAYAQVPAEHEIPTFTLPAPVAGSAIIPTDEVPLPTQGERTSFGENIQLRVLQKLPSRFYFTFTNEESFRIETNPFQYPTKRQYLRQLPPPPVFMNLPGIVQYSDLQSLSLCSDANFILRTLPTMTAGWSLTPNTQIFATYFLIRDSAFYNRKIDTTVQSIAGGLQHNFTITPKSSLQASWQFREFYETLQQPQFDMLPSLTYSYVLTPRTVVYLNSVLQLRGKKYFQPATREIDPFYTGGLMYQKNGWSFSNSATFVQNFRNIFGKNAFIPINDYSFICDFEIARRLYRSLPGLQAYVRTEPIWNFASHNYPGFAGMDFRIYYGLRVSAGKPPLTSAMQQIREQLKEESSPPPRASFNHSAPKSPYLYPYQLTASLPQPIHGGIGDQILREALHSNAPINISAVRGSLTSCPYVPVRHGRRVAYSHQQFTGSARATRQSKPQRTPHPAPPHVVPAPHAPSQATASANRTAQRKIYAAKPAVMQPKPQVPPHKKQAVASRPKKGEFEMLLIPPLPPVNVQSRENPFANSGIDMRPPTLFSTPH